MPHTSIPRLPDWSQSRGRENVQCLCVNCLECEHGCTFWPAQDLLAMERRLQQMFRQAGSHGPCARRRDRRDGEVH
jgi:hypothetical protein